MRPCAGTVGRAVVRLAAVLGGRDAPASTPGGSTAYSDDGLVTKLRRPRVRAGVRLSIRTIGIQREDLQ